MFQTEQAELAAHSRHSAHPSWPVALEDTGAQTEGMMAHWTVLGSARMAAGHCSVPPEEQRSADTMVTEARVVLEDGCHTSCKKRHLRRCQDHNTGISW